MTLVRRLIDRIIGSSAPPGAIATVPRQVELSDDGARPPLLPRLPWLAADRERYLGWAWCPGIVEGWPAAWATRIAFEGAARIDTWVDHRGAVGIWCWARRDHLEPILTLFTTALAAAQRQEKGPRPAIRIVVGKPAQDGDTVLVHVPRIRRSAATLAFLDALHEAADDPAQLFASTSIAGWTLIRRHWEAIGPGGSFPLGPSHPE